jgi:hypothetical protein
LRKSANPSCLVFSFIFLPFLVGFYHTELYYAQYNPTQNNVNSQIKKSTNIFYVQKCANIYRSYNIATPLIANPAPHQYHIVYTFALLLTAQLYITSHPYTPRSPVKPGQYHAPKPPRNPTPLF